MAPAAISNRPSPIGLLCLAGILAFVIALHIGALDHSYLPGWDESVHAAVAGNLAKHPLTPTLFDDPFIHYDSTNWQANHVWLHMPPMPFWQAALAIDLGGRTFFALRLPNLVLCLLTLLLIYFIGLRWHSESVGLIGALLLALSPFAWLLVQGYHFGDMTDVTLAFWLCACFFFLEKAATSQRMQFALWTGVFQGLAFLSKSALALAPTGALLLIWVLPKFGFRTKYFCTWRTVLLHCTVAALLAMTWRFYSSSQWPVEFAYEQKMLWAHVTTSYEGHGQPWDALFNRLLANLFTPVMLLPALAGTWLLCQEAWRQRSAGKLLHPLWILGTFLPLLLVSTKVPAVLYGAAPALALAIGFLICKLLKDPPSAWSSGLAITPVLFLWLSDRFGSNWWSWTSAVTPDMSAMPFLPVQLTLFLAAWILGLLISLVWTKVFLAHSRLNKWLQQSWKLLMSLALIVPMISLYIQGSKVHKGYQVIADYNPVAAGGEKLRPQLEKPAALVVEGITNGRQRPDLTLSFQTGFTAHLANGGALASAIHAAKAKGNAYLFTPLLRQGESIMDPFPGFGYFVYRVKDSLQEPLIQEQAQPQASLSTSSIFDPPVLLSLSLDKAKVKPGQSIQLLALWRLRGSVSSLGTRVFLESMDGTLKDPTFPLPEDFPTGFEAEVLFRLAPPGLLWGDRPLGTGLIDAFQLRPGMTLADGFVGWIPYHLPPGRYRLRLEMFNNGRSVPFEPSFSWPVLDVEK